MVAALARRLAVVAVVSGRPVDYLKGQLRGVPGLVLIGMYGMERDEGGHRMTLPSALAWCDEVAAGARAAELEAPEGIEVERKGLTFALHARGRPDALPWVMEWSMGRAAATGLVAQPGRLSVELLPPVATNKGTVVEELAAGLDAIAFFGDDTGDLPAFAALGRLRAAGKATAGVGVRSPEQPEQLAGAVDLLVDSPREAVELLRALA